MLLNISLANYIFPDIIFDNRLLLHLKLNSVEYFVHVIYRSQIMYHIYIYIYIYIYM